MQEYDKNILEKYNIDVSSTRKVRGAVLCDTSRGVFLLKEVSAPAGRIPSLCGLYAHLMEHGFEGVDYIEPMRTGSMLRRVRTEKNICCADGSGGGNVILENRQSFWRRPGIWRSFM